MSDEMRDDLKGLMQRLDTAARYGRSHTEMRLLISEALEALSLFASFASGVAREKDQAISGPIPTPDEVE